MRLYIDKSNLFSFLSSKGKEGFEDCLRMIKNQLDVYFYFEKECLNQDRELLVLFQGAFASGIGASKKCFYTINSRDYPKRPLKGNCCNSFDSEQLSAIYLLADNEEDKIDFLQKRGNIVLGKKGEELNKLSQLIYDDYQYSMEFPISEMEDIGWSALDKYILPCTDILLIDNYILSDKTKYDHNFYPLIRTLVKCGVGKIVNIVVVTKKKNHNRENNTDFEPDWYEIKEKIKAEVKKEIDAKDTNVTFVFLPKDIDEHDRTIITNYLRIYSGDSYNYLDKNKKIITKSQCIHINSRTYNNTHKYACKAIEKIQKNINEAKTRNNDLILGDKKSSILFF